MLSTTAGLAEGFAATTLAVAPAGARLAPLAPGVAAPAGVPRPIKRPAIPAHIKRFTDVLPPAGTTSKRERPMLARVARPLQGSVCNCVSGRLDQGAAVRMGGEESRNTETAGSGCGPSAGTAGWTSPVMGA